MRIKSGLLLSALLSAPLFLAPPAANATTYVANGSDGDGTLVGTADITLGNGTITITLTDTGTGQISSGQTLSGILFNVSGISSVSLTSSTGSLVNVTGSTVTADTSDAISHWGTGLSSGTVSLETAGPSAKGGKPEDLIVGLSPAGNNGFKNFNPYIEDTATFVLTAPGVTDQSVISNVELLFGTEPFAVVASAVPEPSTWAMMILGFVGVGFMAYRKQARPVRVA